MATAKLVPSVVTLELSFEEAQAVCLILGKITGLAETTPRKYTDEVYWALSDLLGKDELDYNAAMGNIQFKEIL